MRSQRCTIDIVDAAIEHFGRSGFHGAGLRAIADSAGVTAAAIIKFFGSKTTLLEAALQEWEGAVAGVVGADRRGVAYFDGLRRVMAFHVQNRGLVELHATLSTEASDTAHPAHSFVRDRYRRTLREMCLPFHEAVEDGDFAPAPADEFEVESRHLVRRWTVCRSSGCSTPTSICPCAFDGYLDRMLSRLAAHG